MFEGVIVINKEGGWTSQDVVAAVRGVLRVKAGHTGTLDPLAEGVLPVCLGRATKLYDTIMGGRKVYRCECVLGSATDTQDCTGNVLFTGTPPDDAELILAELHRFAEGGGYWQTPPMFSALKVGGERLYDLARRGAVVERTPRFADIYGISDVALGADGVVIFTVECGKGTYVRTICDDLGKALGCGAHMRALTRTRCGGFRIEQAVTVGEFRKMAADWRLSEIIIPIDKVVAYYDGINLQK